MPIGQLANPAGAFGEPIGGAGVGNNNNIIVPCLNNSGAHMKPGDLVAWDTSTALSTVTTTTTGSQQLSTTATSYAVASSASFGTSGLVVAVLTSGGGTTLDPTTPQQLAGLISAKADGTHITISWIRGGGSGSLPAGTVLFVPPNTANGGNGVLALNSTTGAAVQAVTYSIVVNDPLVAGIVAPPIGLDSSTALANVFYPPGAEVPVVVSGLARVYIGGLTVAASGVLTPSNITSTTGFVIGGSGGTAAVGDTIGTALEANGQKDANNTIRCAIKTG